MLADKEQWFWIGEILYICAAMAMRASICVLLLRICVSRWHNITLWALLVINMMFSITSLGLIVFQCKPTEFFWTQYLGATGKCIDHVPLINFTYAFSGISVVSDCIIGILPIFLVWKLQMNLRMKLSVAAILSLGAVYVELSLLYTLNFFPLEHEPILHPVLKNIRVFLLVSIIVQRV